MAIPLRDDAPTRRFPWVTVALILANIVVFLFIQPVYFQTGQPDNDLGAQFSLSHDRLDAERFVYHWGAIPCEVEHGRPLGRLSAGTCGVHRRLASEVLPRDKNVVLSLLTSLFLHGSIAHLAGNMLFLWVFGNNVEDRLGPVPFLLLYLVGGVVATLGHVVLNGNSIEPLVGASGAIAVLMGAYFVFKPRGQILTIVVTAAFQVVYIPAYVVLGLFFVTQFFTPSSTHVAWEAHAVGMAFGALAALVLARFFPDPSAAPPAPAPVASAAVLDHR